jgi:SAM-dependent methyltransferase
MSERSVLQPIDYYDADHWGEPLRTLQERQVVAIDLLEPIVAGGRGKALDVGCGDGLFLAELDRRAGLSTRGWELHGVDYSRSIIEQGEHRGYALRQGNVEEGLPYDDETFDIVTAGEVIEHVYDPDRLAAEARRVLRPGGRLLVTTPNLQAWYNRALFAVGVQPLFYETSTKSTMIGAGPLKRLKRGSIPVGHLRVFNRRALLDLLESEGFRTVVVRGAVFEALPRVIQRIDRAFNGRTSLASNLIVLAMRDR